MKYVTIQITVVAAWVNLLRWIAFRMSCQSKQRRILSNNTKILSKELLRARTISHLEIFVYENNSWFDGKK